VRGGLPALQRREVIRRPDGIQADRLELQLAPVELVAMLRRCLARLRLTTELHTLALELEALEADEPVRLEADGMRLEQVFGNLLGNAIKYSPQGGPITLTVLVDREAALAEVRIRDRGIGIPAEQQAKMFQRFAGKQRARPPDRRHRVGSVCLSRTGRAPWWSYLVRLGRRGRHYLLPDPAPLRTPR
jgi:signal transduction histidine kinase